MSNNREAERIEWIDLAKGIGIILVIIGHSVYYGGMTWNIIFAFHMPLFFILAGFLYKPYDSKSLFIKRIKTLMIPFIIFYFIGVIITLIVPSWRNELTVKGFLQDIYLASPDNVNNSSIWFLICMFLVSVLFNWLYLKLAAQKNKLFITIIACMIIGYALSIFERSVSFLPCNMLPITLDTMFTAIVFYALGFYLRSHKLLDKFFSGILKVFILIGAIALLIVCVHLNGRVNLHSLTFKNPILFYIGALSGSYFIIQISKLLVQSDCMLRKLFMFYGKNSLLILGVQSILIRLYIEIVNTLLDKEFTLYRMSMPYSLLAIILVTFVISPIICIGWKRIKGRIVSTIRKES